MVVSIATQCLGLRSLVMPHRMYLTAFDAFVRIVWVGRHFHCGCVTLWSLMVREEGLVSDFFSFHVEGV